jgi:hypothetical protein
MRSETRIRSLDITAQIEAFFQNGGAVKQCPAGSAIRDDDGLSPRQIGEQTYAVMIDKERAK